MTLKEFKIKIAESSNREWFQNYLLNLKYEHINTDLNFKGVVSLYEFILRQIEGFSSFPKLPKELDQVKNTFIDIKDRIIHLVINSDISIGQWNMNLIRLTSNKPLIFLHDSPETELLIKVNEKNPNYYPGVYEYLSGNLQHVNNKNYMIGYFLAYEFTSKEFSFLAERKDTEKKSISKIRSEFEKSLVEGEQLMTNYLSDANQKYIDYSLKIDQFHSSKEKLYNDWFDTSGQNVKDLEELYRQKLKLEAPAKYWSDRAKKLRSEGNKWLIALVATVTVGVCLLIWALSEISAGTLDKIFQDNGTAIKWSVVFITLISFIAFAIRIFSKLTFSSFHLVRDAEEREQLTYVYLALQKEKNIDDTERHLIMQSLFSRADSGLLKDDSSPTMPGNIAEKIMQR